MKNVVIIAPHPDDETLGAGGTLLKHCDSKDNVYCVFVTNIDEQHGFSKEKVQERQQEIEEVAKLYNFADFYKLNYPTATLTPNDIPDLIKDFSDIFKKIKPQIVYLPYKNDVHSDHRIIFDAAYSCTKSFRCPSIESVLMYETISETEFSSENNFKPTFFVNIENYLDKKTEIMKIYASEVQKAPMPRSVENIKALATYRGAAINRKYAESFEVIKTINF